MAMANICSFCEREDDLQIDFVQSYSTEDSSTGLQDAIMKHFWFTPEELETYLICSTCRNKIVDFYELYSLVESIYMSRYHQEQMDEEYIDVVKSETEINVENQQEDEGGTSNTQLEGEESFVEIETLETVMDEEEGEEEEEEEIILEFKTSEEVDFDEHRQTENMAQFEEQINEKNKLLSNTKIQTENTKAKTRQVKPFSVNPIEAIADEDVRKYCELKCDVCSVECGNFKLLKQHYYESHLVKGYAICCNRKFHASKRFHEHIQGHMGPVSYGCDQCDKTFGNKGSLSRHKTFQHLPDEAKTLECTVCSEKFAKQHFLNAHMIKHKQERDFICETCNKGFVTNYKLQQHIRNIHERAREVMCDICSKVLTCKGNLALHRAEHFSKGPSAQCPKCGKWMKNANSLRKHMDWHREESLVFACSICAKISPSSRALKKHILDQHTAERTHQCTICTKAFKRALHLKEHMATHTGEQLYSCEFCDKKYNSSANLCSHRKKAHPEKWREQQMKKFKAKDEC